MKGKEYAEHIWQEGFLQCDATREVAGGGGDVYFQWKQGWTIGVLLHSSWHCTVRGDGEWLGAARNKDV